MRSKAVYRSLTPINAPYNHRRYLLCYVMFRRDNAENGQAVEISYLKSGGIKMGLKFQLQNANMSCVILIYY